MHADPIHGIDPTGLFGSATEIGIAMSIAGGIGGGVVGWLADKGPGGVIGGAIIGAVGGYCIAHSIAIGLPAALGLHGLNTGTLQQCILFGILGSVAGGSLFYEGTKGVEPTGSQVTQIADAVKKIVATQGFTEYARLYGNYVGKDGISAISIIPFEGDSWGQDTTFLDKLILTDRVVNPHKVDPVSPRQR